MQIVNWSQLTDEEKVIILQRSNTNRDTVLHDTVSEIILCVKNQGDCALFEYTKKFDKVELSSLKVSPEESESAIKILNEKEKQAIITAAENIKYFHTKSAPKAFEYEKNGINLGKIYRPIDKVGLYVPGGSAPLVSTLLMLAIPAKIAGCKTKVLTTPPDTSGKIAPAILFAANICEIDTIYKVGGAQAIAAMAFGTQTIPKVHKIYGPGNKFVTEAKMQVSLMNGGAALDMPAGPSEVLVIADDDANAIFVASDLLAQAEHDKDAHVILVTTSGILANKVLSEIKRQTAYLSRNLIIDESLKKSSIIIANSINECFMISNRYAPEHLILHINNAKDALELVQNAGSVFVGEYSPESVGDYASGTNHVLPTYGYANMYSGLDTLAFMKAISFQHLSATGLKHIGHTVETLASLEGLDAHKNAVTVRLKEIK
ncbi:MAG: hisD [Burkholderiales bacterium]|jgi:histidinol dehydrogenase|nr:hisD [Burkholderiales bacterium]